MTEIEPVRRPWLELKTIVEQGSVTRNHLAEATGYSRQQVHNLITGRSRVTTPAIRKFAAALGVPYSVLEPHDGATTGPLGYSIDEASAMLNVDRERIERMVTNGTIKVYVVDGDEIRVRADEIDRIVAGDAA
jgi:excisionase family DNA binding protein